MPVRIACGTGRHTTPAREDWLQIGIERIKKNNDRRLLISNYNCLVSSTLKWLNWKLQRIGRLIGWLAIAIEVENRVRSIQLSLGLRIQILSESFDRYFSRRISSHLRLSKFRNRLKLVNVLGCIWIKCVETIYSVIAKEVHVTAFPSWQECTREWSLRVVDILRTNSIIVNKG